MWFTGECDEGPASHLGLGGGGLDWEWVMATKSGRSLSADASLNEHGAGLATCGAIVRPTGGDDAMAGQGQVVSFIALMSSALMGNAQGTRALASRRQRLGPSSSWCTLAST